MTTTLPQPGGAVEHGSASDLAEVVGTILDKGVVIDAHVSVGLIGIKLLTIDARVVVASVDTYLRFAEATNRLDLDGSQAGKGLPEIVQGPKGTFLDKAGDALGELVGGDDDRDRDRDRDRDANDRDASRGRDSDPDRGARRQRRGGR